jgi:hypothetical protein
MKNDPAYQGAYRSTHKDNQAAYGRAHYLSNKERVKARVRAYYLSHREELAAYRRARNIGCSPGEIKPWMAKDRTCWLCGEPGGTQLDHDHADGRIRGWAHAHCNAAEGRVALAPDPKCLLHTLLLSYP